MTGGLNDVLKTEISSNLDMLVANFEDNYRNLSLKTYAALLWAHECRSAQFVFKTDSDVMVSLKNLAIFVKEKQRRTDAIFGFCWTDASVLRDTTIPDGKWRV